MPPAEAEALQRELAARVSESDRPGQPATVAGLDVSYGEQGASAAAVLLHLPDLQLLDQATVRSLKEVALSAIYFHFDHTSARSFAGALFPTTRRTLLPCRSTAASGSALISASAASMASISVSHAEKSKSTASP